MNQKVSLFQKSYPIMFPCILTSDSQNGKNTLERYKSCVNLCSKQLESICSKNERRFQTIQDLVNQNCFTLDNLREQFLLDSNESFLFQSEDDARELVDIVILDVKKVILDRALLVAEKKNRSLHRLQKEQRRIIQREITDYTPTATTKKKRPNLPVQAKDILSNWFREHVDHPYPTQSEKMELSELTGLTLQKVDNWFINERSRKWQTYKRR